MTTEPTHPPDEQKKSSQINVLRVLLTTAIIAFLACGTLLMLRSRFSLMGSSPENSALLANAPGSGPAELRVGAQIPDFPVRKFGTHDWPKISQLPGKVIMINFWASWCEACMQEMPSIIRLQDAYKSKGLTLVAINLDESPDEAIPKVVKKFKMDFPIFTDPEGKIAEIFDVHAIPLTVILDSKRRILMFENSELDWDSADVHSKMQKWLSL
jgi:thiol-disulfide isomerase/thioredoxin